MADLAEREGARTEFIPSLGPSPRPDRDATALARIVAIARRFRPHLVHTHTAKAGFLGRLAALTALRPRPVIVHTYHGHVLEGYFGPAMSRVYRSLETALGRRSDCLVGVSEATVDDLVRLGVAPRDRFRVIPLGLDLAPFADLDRDAGLELRRELGIGDEEVVLTFVGRLVPIKRVDVLLRALALARRSRAVAAARRRRRRAAGPISRRSAASSESTDRVRFLGYRRDLTKIAAAADVAVLTLRERGHPRLADRGGGGGITRGGDRRRRRRRRGGAGDRDPRRCRGQPGGGRRARATRRRSGSAGPYWAHAASERALRRYSAARLIADIDALYGELLGRRRSARMSALRPRRATIRRRPVR